MLPITNQEIQRALPSNETAARVVRPEEGESFADTMKRARVGTDVDHGAVDESQAQSKRSEPSFDEGDVESPSREKVASESVIREVPGMRAALLVGVPEGAMQLTKLMQPEGLANAPHGRAKHEKHGGEDADNDGGIENVPSGAMQVSALQVGVMQSDPSAVVPGPVVAPPSAPGQGASKGQSKTDKQSTVDAVIIAGQARTKAGDAQSHSTEAPELGTQRVDGEKMAQAVHVELPQPDGATRIDKPAVVASTDATSANAVEHGAKARVLPLSSMLTIESKTSSVTGDELTVLSYESSTSSRLEIGVTGGSWGLLKVRAEVGQGGEVHAFLRGTSVGVESELRAQTVDLQAYLGMQQVGVHAVHVETSRPVAWAMTADSGGGTSREPSQRERSTSDSNCRGTAEKSAKGVELFAASSFEGNWMPLPRGLNGAGGWLNVLA